MKLCERVALAESLFQKGVPRNARCGNEAFTLLSLLTGICCTVVLCLLPRTPSFAGDQPLIQEPALGMAMQQQQVVRNRQIMKPSLTTQPATQPLEARQSRHPAALSKSLAIHAARPGPLVRSGEEYWDEIIEDEYDDRSGGGTSEGGRLSRWNADMGFGFIQPSGGGDDLYCHVSSLVEGEDSVQRGGYVTFIKYYNSRTGKYEALEVRPDRTQVAEPLSGTAEGGVVRKFNADQGFGFINPDGSREDVFVHVSNVQQGDTLERRDKVTFVKWFDPRQSKCQAMDVKVIEKGTGELLRQGPSESAVEGKGQLVHWNGERGFGFVMPDNNIQELLFIHISEIVNGEDSVKPGDLVTYLKDFNKRKGIYQAYQVKYSGEGPPLQFGETSS